MKRRRPFFIGLAKRFIWLMNTLLNKVLGENENCIQFILQHAGPVTISSTVSPETPIGISLLSLRRYSVEHHFSELSVLIIWILVLPSRSLIFWEHRIALHLFCIIPNTLHIVKGKSIINLYQSNAVIRSNDKIPEHNPSTT